MNRGDRRRVELILPMRTVLLVAASVGVLRRVPGDRRHVPGRVHRDLPRARLRVPGARRDGEDPPVPRPRCDRDRARHRPPRRAARPAAARAARGERARLPPRPAADGSEPARLRRARLPRRLRRRRERPVGRRGDLRIGTRRDQRRARHRRQLLRRLPGLLHDPVHLPLPAHRRRQPQARARERADAGRRRALAGRVGAHHRRRSPAGRSASS